MSADAKRIHETEVFQGFVAASRLPIDPASIRGLEPPRPDIECAGPDGEWLFELAEVLWQVQTPDAAVRTLAHGLAQSERASDQKANLLAAGQIEDAERIQTSGGFGYPALLSLIQALEKKCRKHYTLDGPIFLLLYYERQDPVEPFDWLAERFRDLMQTLLTSGQFSVVWLYHPAVTHSFDLSEIKPSETPVAIPLRTFLAPEPQKASHWPPFDERRRPLDSIRRFV